MAYPEEALPKLTMSELTDYQRMDHEQRQAREFFGQFELVDDEGRRYTHFRIDNHEEIPNNFGIPLDRLEALGGLALPVHEVIIVAPATEAWVGLRMWSVRQELWKSGDESLQRHGDFWDGVAIGLMGANKKINPEIGPVLDFPATAGTLMRGSPDASSNRM